MSNALVDTLGVLAGVVWMSGAIFYQMMYDRRVPPQYILSMFAIGVALFMISSAVALSERPALAVALGVVGNMVFVVLGVAAWWRVGQSVEDESDDDHAKWPHS